MAGLNTLVFQQSFTSTDTISVTHNAGSRFINVRVLIANEYRSDLVDSIIVVNQNEISVSLKSAQSGVVQVFEPDLIGAESAGAFGDGSRLYISYTQETSSGQVSPFLVSTSKTSDGFISISRIPYLGTASGTPTSIIIRAAYGVGTGSYSLRIVDLDNGSAIVASITGQTNTALADIDFGTISNLSTGRSNWDFQISVTNTQDRDIQLAWLTINYN